MSILDRISTVVKSNLNSLLSTAEDPAKLVNQAIVDMEESLRDGKKELIGIMAEERVVGKRVEEKGAEADEWERKAMLALKASDEALARAALERKQRALTEKASLEATLKEHRRYIDDMRMNLDLCEKKLQDAKLKKDSVIARAKAQGAGGYAKPSGLASSEAFETFDRHAAQIERMDAEAAAQEEVGAALKDPKADDVERRFRELERSGANPAVEDELAALKAKLGK
ncbi:MAG TPA: PspA/IM30 family protein [Myxococcota bacterium]|jgi:phage shock protein A|nr:PspA/IM30 family protein [Myxococcota bacterium]